MYHLSPIMTILHIRHRILLPLLIRIHNRDMRLSIQHMIYMPSMLLKSIVTVLGKALNV